MTGCHHLPHQILIWLPPLSQACLDVHSVYSDFIGHEVDASEALFWLYVPTRAFCLISWIFSQYINFFCFYSFMLLLIPQKRSSPTKATLAAFLAELSVIFCGDFFHKTELISYKTGIITKLRGINAEE